MPDTGSASLLKKSSPSTPMEYKKSTENVCAGGGGGGGYLPATPNDLDISKMSIGSKWNLNVEQVSLSVLLPSGLQAYENRHFRADDVDKLFHHDVVPKNELELALKRIAEAVKNLPSNASSDKRFAVMKEIQLAESELLSRTLSGCNKDVSSVLLYQYIKEKLIDQLFKIWSPHSAEESEHIPKDVSGALSIVPDLIILNEKISCGCLIFIVPRIFDTEEDGDDCTAFKCFKSMAHIARCLASREWNLFGIITQPDNLHGALLLKYQDEHTSSKKLLQCQEVYCFHSILNAVTASLNDC